MLGSTSSVAQLCAAPCAYYKGLCRPLQHASCLANLAHSAEVNTTAKHRLIVRMVT